MTGLRRRLLLAFGGLLALLLVLGATSIALLDHYSSTLDRIFRENYDTVLFAQNMKDSVEDLDEIAERALWEPGTTTERDTAAAIEVFETNLRGELGNITLPGEGDAARRLAAEWQAYKVQLAQQFAGGTDADRRAGYRDRLRPLSESVRSSAQHIIDLNMANMVSIDGRVREQAESARRGMLLLMGLGGLLAVAFSTAIGRAILRPVSALTDSVREIERGNLELSVPVSSRDELGQLAEAFNSMAERLREFRQSDRAVLARTQRTTQLALNSFPDAVAVIAPDGSVELANQAARRLFGLDPGVNIADSGIPGLREVLSRTAETKQPYRASGYGSTIRVLDDGEKFFQPQAVPIVSEDGAALGVTLVLSDVTKLRTLDERKSALIALVSHELKTPLTTIRMATHLLAEHASAGLEPRDRQLLEAAREESDRMHSILESLLDIGRLESDRPLDLAPADAASLLRSAADSVSAAFREKGVVVEVVDPVLPPVLVDSNRLSHVLANLLANALRHTPPGGRVRLSAEREGDMASISVVDDGSGIAPADLPRIFDRFYRAPGQSAQSGAGLGLSIVKEIVEAHGGSVRVESTKGRGSTFRFTLRLANPSSMTAA